MNNFKEELSKEILGRISDFVNLDQSEKDAITEYIHEHIERPKFFNMDEKYVMGSKTHSFIESVMYEVNHLY